MCLARYLKNLLHTEQTGMLTTFKNRSFTQLWLSLTTEQRCLLSLWPAPHFTISNKCSFYIQKVQQRKERNTYVEIYASYKCSHQKGRINYNSDANTQWPSWICYIVLCGMTLSQNFRKC